MLFLRKLNKLSSIKYDSFVHLVLIQLNDLEIGDKTLKYVRRDEL